MAQNPFTADFGTYQGRIVSSEAVQGTHVYQLGHELRGRLFFFEPGQKHVTAQTPDVTGVKAIRATVITHGAHTMPAGAAWRLRLLVDGSAVAERTLDARSIVLGDIAANLHGAGLSGNHAIAFELAIVGGTGPYEAELPGCAVDAVIADSTGVALEVINRNPQPGETGVAVGGPFVFDLESSAGSAAPDTSRTTITVDGVVVCLNSTFQAGWLSSSRIATASSGWRFSLVPDVPLAPSATHTIGVTSALVGGPAEQLKASWSFSTVDTVAPTVIEAFALREKQVRVTFSETVKQTSASATNDALNPANYVITLEGGWPAVTPSVVSVETDGLDRVILTFDIPMTRRTTYRVTASNVEDMNDNVVAAPTNSALFVGYAFPVPSDRDFDLYRLWVTADQKAQDLPPAGTGDLKMLFDIWQEPIDLLLGIIDKLADIYDPDLAPEAFVDLMLIEMGNPFDFPLTEIEKRKLVQILVPIYQSKGTGPGIVDAIRLFMGIEVTLNVYAWSPVPLGEALMGIDWILGSDDPQDLLTFQVLVPRVLTVEERSKMSQIIDYMMDTREFFVILEPADIITPDHWQMGYSQLGVNTIFH